MINKMRLSSRLADYLLLSISWLGVVILVNPSGDFPLNDDWAYAANVCHFLETGTLEFNDWLAMTLVVQVLWGALWAAVWGCTHEVLRWSTLLLAWLSVLLVYQLIRELSNRRNWALLGSCCLLVNPWFVLLAFSFMTDIPFLFCFTAALRCFSRVLQRRNRWAFIWGLVWSLLATGIRQYGLLAPLGFAIAYAWQQRHWRSVLLGLGPLVLCFIALVSYSRWMEATYGLPDGWGHPGLLWSRLTAQNPFIAFYERGGIMAWGWGLSLIPVTVYVWPGIRKSNRWQWGGSSLIIVVLALGSWGEIPWGNTLYNVGLGPITLKRYDFDPPFELPLSVAGWIAVCVLGLVAAVPLIKAYTSFKSLQIPAVYWFGWSMLLVYTGYLTVDVYMWDRYLLVALPLWLILLSTGHTNGGNQKIRSWLAVLLLVLLGTFSILATHDYLAWNRVRWQLLNQLEGRGVAAASIDGGFEYNASRMAGPRRAVSRKGKSWWFVQEDTYVISLVPVGCYQLDSVAPIKRWLPIGRDSVYLLKHPGFVRRDTYQTSAEWLVDAGTTEAELSWGNTERVDSTHAHSGRYSQRLEAANPFGFTATLTELKPCDRVALSAWRYSAGVGGRLVFSAPEAKDYYESSWFVAQPNVAGWDQLQHEVTIPPDYPSDQMTLYIWHEHPVEAWYDDVQIVVSRVRH